MKPSNFYSAILLAASTAVPASAQNNRQIAADVDAFVQRVVSLSGTAGLSIAVVKGDQPLLVKGYGFADIERKRPVTENTAFYIASTTKAFTALAMALMADKKVVDLDAPLTRYLADVKWGEGVNADNVTLRSLLTHTHGIGNNGPVVWRTAFTGEHDNALLKELLQHHTASNQGRNYSYTNLGYNVAGIIIDQVTRGKWQDALTTNVMKPLGMTSTTPYISQLDSSRLAMPYTMDPNGPRRVHYAKGDANMQAAGGLVSTASDLAKWLEVQINQGKLDGKQIFPQHVIAETQRLQVSASERRGEMQMIGYTLGWMVSLSGSDTVLHHGGGFSVFRTNIALIPKQKIGLAVMVNEGNLGMAAVELITQYVLDRAREVPGWREKYDQTLAQLPARLEKAREGITQDRQRRAARPQTLPYPLETYAGTYENPQGGTMRWTVRDGRLWVQMGLLKSVTEVFDAANNRMRAELEPGTGNVLSFKIENGRAVSVTYSNLEFKRVD
jgi:CubicO group peptidase (beta-lactamase class C family)